MPGASLYSIWTPLLRAVAEAREAGLVRGDPMTLAHVFWAGLHGLVSLQLSGALHNGSTLDSLVEPMLDTLFTGAHPRAAQEESR